MIVLILRHAHAGDRDEWDADDTDRPLDKRGRTQALALRALARRPVRRIVSSPYARCVQTVEPLAEAIGVEIELDDRLAEGTPRGLAMKLLAELDGGVACTHGDVIEGLLGYGLRKGAAVLADVDGGGLHVQEVLPAP